ncbi:MAG: hypothetical protein HY242_08920 [Afipia sp.]|nr:hypothetical protein [Afipia sp.]
MRQKSQDILNLYSAVKVGLIVLFAGLFDMQHPGAARGGFAAEHPLASEHVETLPKDIRREISKHERDCGNKASAAHYFAVSIEADGQKFVSLHFEDFACANRAAICREDGCLHEVYAEARGRHRLVFSAHARDVKMTNDRGVVKLRIENGVSARVLKWNGRSFLSGPDNSTAGNPVARSDLNSGDLKNAR